jgi:hypothetical protein
LIGGGKIKENENSPLITENGGAVKGENKPEYNCPQNWRTVAYRLYLINTVSFYYHEERRSNR